jgi:cephalosporin-C deacetylase
VFDHHESPEDLEDFWRTLAAEANSVKLDYHRVRTDRSSPSGHVVDELAFTGMGGRTLYGWIAYEEEARRAPSFLWLAPYGRESKLPDEYGTRAGFTSLSFNFHGERAFHQERYAIERGYFADGAGDPETWVFRRMLGDAIVATRVLQAQIEADENRIGSMGMSQGAGMSIWLGAWCPIVKAVCADMPFLGRIADSLSGQVYRYPTKELIDAMDTMPVGRERILNTVRYFDTVFQAGHCRVPTQVSLGLKDPASKPDNVRAIYEALPGPKRLQVYDWGHDWHPEMISSNAEWLSESFTRSV